MKWLLVTTNPTPYVPGTEHPHHAGWNVGDVFARLGVEELVRDVDPGAEIALVNMDSEDSIVRSVPFDRAIFAGRPMFWTGCRSHALWTHLLNGWLCADPRKVLALGVGDCFPLLPDPDRSAEHMRLLMDLVADAEKRVWRLTTRRRLPSVPFTPCPATWVLLDRPEKQEVKLCNLMENGGHYRTSADCEVWNRTLPSFARNLQRTGYNFVAHSAAEFSLGVRLGFRDVIVHDRVEDYLSTYASATAYVGNRVHGALVLASRRAVATVIGNDTRILAARDAGLRFATISNPIPSPDLNLLGNRIREIRLARDEARDLVHRFAYD